MLLSNDTAQQVLKEPGHGLGKTDYTRDYHIIKLLPGENRRVVLCGWESQIRLKGWRPAGQKQFVCEACWRVFCGKQGTPENTQRPLRMREEDKRMALTYNLEIPPGVLELLPPEARQVLEREAIEVLLLAYGVRYELTPESYEKFLALAKEPGLKAGAK